MNLLETNVLKHELSCKRLHLHYKCNSIQDAVALLAVTGTLTHIFTFSKKLLTLT